MEVRREVLDAPQSRRRRWVRPQGFLAGVGVAVLGCSALGCGSVGQDQALEDAVRTAYQSRLPEMTWGTRCEVPLEGEPRCSVGFARKDGETWTLSDAFRVAGEAKSGVAQALPIRIGNSIVFPPAGAQVNPAVVIGKGAMVALELRCAGGTPASALPYPARAQNESDAAALLREAERRQCVLVRPTLAGAVVYRTGD